MKIFRIILFVFVLAIFSTPLWAVDYRPDSTFNPQFALGDTVYNILVQADGKILAGGAFCQSSTSSCSPFVRRLNTDGTIDPTFNAVLSPIDQNHGEVRSIKQLPTGKVLITGTFKIGSQPTNYARLNADGSLDPTMALAYISSDVIEPLPDGKFLACGPRTINGQNYDVAHRMNSDGSPDPSFRITFMVGNCGGITALPNGKTLMTMSTSTGQGQIPPLYRLNPDGSNDTSFSTNLPIGSYASGLIILPDGKLLIRSSTQNGHLERLFPDGALDITVPLCAGGTFVPVADGSIITNQCKRWTFHFGSPLEFARVFPDGSVDQTLDNIYFSNDVWGFSDAGNDRYYAYGKFTHVQSSPHDHIVRLVPNLSPLKAKFDFDNDGKSDIAVFRPSDSYWYLNQSSLGFTYMQWGLSTDLPAAGHFDNDGKTDIAVFRDGVWHAYSSAFGHRTLFLGAAGDKPMLGNFEDQGADIEDIAVRGLSEGVVKWSIREGGSFATPIGGSSISIIPSELLSDKPVVGDFNGDGRDDIGYFRDGVWNTFDYRGYAPPITLQWGMAGDIPVPGDYDGDRQTDFAIFRPSTGDWWINRSSQGTLGVHFGVNGDIPVPADYDGDGKIDIAIYRNGVWYQFLSASGTVHGEQWGLPGDIPIPSQNQ